MDFNLNIIADPRPGGSTTSTIVKRKNKYELRRMHNKKKQEKLQRRQKQPLNNNNNKKTQYNSNNSRPSTTAPKNDIAKGDDSTKAKKRFDEQRKIDDRTNVIKVDTVHSKNRDTNDRSIDRMDTENYNENANDDTLTKSIANSRNQSTSDNNNSNNIIVDDNAEKDTNNVSNNNDKNENKLNDQEMSYNDDTNNNQPRTTILNNTNDSDIAARAAYLAEFHARPYELDRRSTNNTNSKIRNKIKKSKDSSHLFVQSYEKTTAIETANSFDSDNDVKLSNNNNNNYISKDDDDTTTNSKATGTAHTTAHNENVTTIISRWDQMNQYLHPKLVEAASKLHPQPTIVQSRSIPSFFISSSNNNTKNTNNVLIQAETGSGKTLAYLLPIIQSSFFSSSSDTDNMTSRKECGTKILIICPTRELAIQTMNIVECLLKNANLLHKIIPGLLIGEEKRKSEKARIRKGLSIIIATPGRLLDHFYKTESLLHHITNNNNLQWLILDEGDKLLLYDKGLGEQVQNIIRCIHNADNTTKTATTTPNTNFRTVLVSATISSQLKNTANDMLRPRQSDDNSSAITRSAKGSSSINDPTREWTIVLGTSKSKKSSSIRISEQPQTPLLPTINEDNEDENNDNLNDDYNVIENAMQQSTQGNDAIDDENVLLGNATPRQLQHLYVLVSAKLRLPALIAFLHQRIAAGERTVVFVSTCAAADYYYELFNTYRDNSKTINDSSNDSNQNKYNHNNSSYNTNKKKQKGNNNTESSDNGPVFGNCTFYKLHGNIAHGERQLTMKKFMNTTSAPQSSSCVLFTTDVAARGLNLPNIDWIIQYDPPGEVSDYVHRAGRVARAGKSGYCLLFLLPSERTYLDVLNKRGVPNISPMSLTSILASTAALCKSITDDGIRRCGGSLNNSNGDSISSSRLGEAFCTEIQYRLESFVLDDDMKAKNAARETRKALQRNSKKNYSNKKGETQIQQHHEQQQQQSDGSGILIELARRAFLSHIRAYPTKEKFVRHIFSPKALHLGHIARSFALKEPPKKVFGGTSTMNSKVSTTVNKRKAVDDAMIDNKTNKLNDIYAKKQRTNEKMKFSNNNKNVTVVSASQKRQHKADNNQGVVLAENIHKKRRNVATSYSQSDNTTNHKNPINARTQLMTNALKLQNIGMDGM